MGKLTINPTIPVVSQPTNSQIDEAHKVLLPSASSDPFPYSLESQQSSFKVPLALGAR